MEYAPFGDLSRALRKRQAQRKLLPEDLIWSYFIQIARGLQALHAQKILHRDVKTANVLRMSGEVVKLGDLGVAKLMKAGGPAAVSVQFTGAVSVHATITTRLSTRLYVIVHQQ